MAPYLASAPGVGHRHHGQPVDERAGAVVGRRDDHRARRVGIAPAPAAGGVLLRGRHHAFGEGLGPGLLRRHHEAAGGVGIGGARAAPRQDQRVAGFDLVVLRRQHHAAGGVDQPVALAAAGWGTARARSGRRLAKRPPSGPRPRDRRCARRRGHEVRCGAWEGRCGFDARQCALPEAGCRGLGDDRLALSRRTVDPGAWPACRPAPPVLQCRCRNPPRERCP
jgi:hypothetical protein